MYLAPSVQLTLSDTIWLASILFVAGGGLALLYVHMQRLHRRAAEAEERALVAAAELQVIKAQADVEGARADLAEHNAEQFHQFSDALLEAATVMIIGVDEAGHLRVFNRAAERITGYCRGDWEEYDWLETLFPGEEFIPAREALTNLMRGDLNAELETLLIARHGEERLIEWECRFVHYQDEPISLMFGMDLTERTQAERERHDLERKLLDMQKLESLGVLAGGIAHDFNNLLTAILGNAQMAKMQSVRQSPVRQYLTEIERTSLQAADLCKQMLAYSGQGKIEVRHIDVNRIIRDMSQLLRISVDRKVHLSFDLVHSVPLIQGDVSQIRQVLMNLIINASEAIGNKEGSIWVSTGTVHGAKKLFRGTPVTGEPQERDYIFVSVTDTGCGMDEETRAKLFDPFFTTKFTGRGLGLAAVLGIVRGHGGTLELTSKVGEGTTFTLLFPITEVEAPLPKEEEELPAESAWKANGLLLVVDDEESVRMLTRLMVESFCFRVQEAANGKEAVEAFEKNPGAFTAVLMDVTMPVMSGLEAYKKIRAMRPDIPVLFLSGYMRDGELQNLSAPADFLHKPFKIDDLRSKLRGLVTP